MRCQEVCDPAFPFLVNSKILMLSRITEYLVWRLHAEVTKAVVTLASNSLFTTFSSRKEIVF
jgi:hypothetical protein